MKTIILLATNVVSLGVVATGLMTVHVPDGPVVVLLPLGDVDLEMVHDLALSMMKRLDVVVRVDDARGLPPGAYDADWDRYDADAVMTEVAKSMPDGAWRAVSITRERLVRDAESLGHPVVGSGGLRGKQAIISTLWMEEGAPRHIALRRLTDLLLHEWGHTAGLRHCSMPGCLMEDSGGHLTEWVRRSDRRFCAFCRQHLPDGMVLERHATSRDPREPSQVWPVGTGILPWGWDRWREMPSRSW